MPATTELTEAYAYFHARLKAQAALAALPVVIGEAPAGTAGKWVVQQRQGGDDVNAIGAYRAFSEFVMLVKAVMQTSSFADIAAEAAAIDTALHGAREEETPSGLAFVHIVRREEGWDQQETRGTVEYRSLGGLYRIQLQLL